MNPRITVVTVTHNSEHVLREFFKSIDLASSAEDDVAVVVVDSGSTDDRETKQIAEEMGATFIAASGNVGYGTASNLGASSARSDYVVFVNPDVAIGAQSLLEMASRAAKLGIACIGPLLRSSDGTDQHTFRSAIRPLWSRRPAQTSPSGGPDDVVEVETVSGCCMVVNRDAFQEVGGFDESFFMFCEETDLHTRLRAAKRKVAVDLAHVAVSEGGASSAGVSRRWSVTERSIAHVQYTRKHFSFAATAIDWTWRLAQILFGGEYKPRGKSFAQFVQGTLGANPYGR